MIVPYSPFGVFPNANKAFPKIGIGSGPGISMPNLYDSCDLKYTWMAVIANNKNKMSKKTVENPMPPLAAGPINVNRLSAIVTFVHNYFIHNFKSNYFEYIQHIFAYKMFKLFFLIQFKVVHSTGTHMHTVKM